MRKVYLKVALALAAVLVASGILVGGAQVQDRDEPERERQRAFLCIEGMDGGSTHEGFERCFEPVGFQFESEREEEPPTGRRSEPSIRATIGLPFKSAGPLLQAHREGREFNARLVFEGETLLQWPPSMWVLIYQMCWDLVGDPQTCGTQPPPAGPDNEPLVWITLSPR